ncbi:unnamed protein product [Ixodes hexagonus]
MFRENARPQEITHPFFWLNICNIKILKDRPPPIPVGGHAISDGNRINRAICCTGTSGKRVCSGYLRFCLQSARAISIPH